MEYSSFDRHDSGQPVERLSHAAFQWLRALPQEVQPIELARTFPRIANLIAGYWDNPEACETYLNRLIFDPRRPTRQGFPVKVASEILKLHLHLTSRQPVPMTHEAVPFRAFAR